MWEIHDFWKGFQRLGSSLHLGCQFLSISRYDFPSARPLDQSYIQMPANHQTCCLTYRWTNLIKNLEILLVIHATQLSSKSVKSSGSWLFIGWVTDHVTSKPPSNVSYYCFQMDNSELLYVFCMCCFHFVSLGHSSLLLQDHTASAAKHCILTK